MLHGYIKLVISVVLSTRKMLRPCQISFLDGKNAFVFEPGFPCVFYPDMFFELHVTCVFLTR